MVAGTVGIIVKVLVWVVLIMVVLELLVEEVKVRKIFKRNKKDVRLKVLVAILYYLGISLRKKVMPSLS